MLAARTRAASKPPTDKDKLAAAAEAPAAETPPDGFFVQTIQDENGNVTTQVAPIGDRRITEAPVFLKKALAVVNESLGIE
jgi:hypothetical protein